MNKRHVLINGLLLNDNFSGVQYYIENLTKAMGGISKTIEVDILLPQNYGGNIQLCDHLYPRKLTIDTTKRITRIFFEHFQLMNYVKKNHYPLLHSPGYILPYRGFVPSVVTIHDLIALDYPEYCLRESSAYFKLCLPHSIKNASKIIAVSHRVKSDILRRYNVSPDKIEVIYHGISEKILQVKDNQTLHRIRNIYHLPESYLLFVGNIEPKKNIERIIQAFQLLKRTTEIKQKLVVTGKKGWKYQSIFKLVNDLHLKDDIFFTGYVPEEDLSSIYSLADVFVFPSLYEGFGIPPLEAMACKVPVLVSNRGALPEVTGGVCLQVDPFNIEAMAKGIYRLLTEDALRKWQIAEGEKWVKNFTWDKAAAQTLRIYEKILNSSKHGCIC
jgi:glycosyltransferase involved in cell wall biosynthesis